MRDREGRRKKVEEKHMRGTTGESGTRETRIAQPQKGYFPKRMYKHKADFFFFWEVWLFFEWIVCLSVTMQGVTRETFKGTVITKLSK